MGSYKFEVCLSGRLTMVGIPGLGGVTGCELRSACWLFELQERLARFMGTEESIIYSYDRQLCRASFPHLQTPRTSSSATMVRRCSPKS